MGLHSEHSRHVPREKRLRVQYEATAVLAQGLGATSSTVHRYEVVEDTRGRASRPPDKKSIADAGVSEWVISAFLHACAGQGRYLSRRRTRGTRVNHRDTPHSGILRPANTGQGRILSEVP